MMGAVVVLLYVLAASTTYRILRLDRASVARAAVAALFWPYVAARVTVLGIGTTCDACHGAGCALCHGTGEEP